MSTALEKARSARKERKRKGPVKHFIRAKSGGTVEVELTRSKAIKAMCTECCGFGELHPKDCSSPICPLYPFRGKIQLAYQDPNETPDVGDTEEDEDTEE